MTKVRFPNLWWKWGLIPRLMAAVGFAILVGGVTQNYLLALEGATVIGSECVIGPYSRIVEASIGRGVELAGWNYVARTSVRNHAVLEPYARRGLD